MKEAGAVPLSGLHFIPVNPLTGGRQGVTGAGVGWVQSLQLSRMDSREGRES